MAKSLGQGIGKNVFFKEIIISNNTDGKPIVSLSGRTLLYVTTLNIKEIKLSITSTKMYCIAFAVSLYA